MGIRIQPIEIEVPEDNPFANDSLEREEPIKVLTHLLHSIDGPCVLAVDAAWGEGKSTFLRLWSQYLRNQGFPVIEFNAWLTDFSDEPFLVLSTELTEGFKDYPKGAAAERIAETKKLAKDIFRQTATSAARVFSSGLVDIDALMKQRFSRYNESKDLIENFKSTLKEMAAAVSKCKKKNSMIVVIDELDRCRPSYAVGLLEAAKHLFSVNGIIFVLAVNRTQLAHSIKALYGRDFDSLGYLQRFIDIDFQLPLPKRKKFIENILTTISFLDYFERTNDADANQSFPSVKKFSQNIFETTELSIRQISQAFHRLGLVLGSLRSDRRAFAYSAVVAIFLRSINAGTYHRFCRGEITDLEVVDEIFNYPGIKILQGTHDGCLIEAYITEGAKEILRKNSPEEDIKSPLLTRYRSIIESGNSSSKKDQMRAEKVIELIEYLSKHPNHVGFLYSVSRIELLTPELIKSD